MIELLRGERDLVRVGHRGAAALAPDNSLAAIEAAAAHGVDVVELDVTAVDGGLVLAHDGDEPSAPPLDEGLALAARLGLAVLVDVKTRGIEGAVVEALRRHGLLGRSFVSSVSPPILRAFAAAEPALPRSFTYPADRAGLSSSVLLRPVLAAAMALARAALPWRIGRKLRAVGASAATLNEAVISRRAVDACHDCGAAVYAWTVEDPDRVRSLLAAGVDGIITDNPRRLAAGTFRTT